MPATHRPCPAWGPPAGFGACTPAHPPVPTVLRMPPPRLIVDPTLLDHAFPPLLPARWHLLEAIYTDGACVTQDEGPNLLGAAVYVASSHVTITVAPHGHRETNTITRAELAGLHAALAHVQYLPTPVAIFCDSLAALYETQRVVHMPHTLLTHKHYPMLSSIRSLVLTRARLSLPTHIQKVKSHIGIYGNEQADAGASYALHHPDSCDVSLADVDAAHFSTLLAWPCHPPPAPDGAPAGLPTPDTCYFLGDLHDALSRYLLTEASHLYDGPGENRTLYAAQQAVTADAVPDISNHMWHSSACHWPLIRTVLKLRYQQVWTASRALTFQRPYVTLLGHINTGRCPICPLSSPHARDTVGHILGGCMHPRLRALYIARHNRALLLVHAAFLSGSQGRDCVILDATSTRRLPCGVSGTRVPRWALPHLSPDVVAAMRPDFMLIENLLATHAAVSRPCALLSPTHLADIQRTCPVRILELGYTHEHSHAGGLARKRAQHASLVNELRLAGWTVSPCGSDDVHVLLLGTCATIYNSSPAVLAAFGFLNRLFHSFCAPYMSMLMNLHTPFFPRDASLSVILLIYVSWHLLLLYCKILPDTCTAAVQSWP